MTILIALFQHLFGKKNIFLMLLVSTLPLTSYAFGVGEIELNSALNQPLNARIELVGITPKEFLNLSVRHASVKKYRKLGISLPTPSDELQLSLIKENGKKYIHLSTGQSVKNPFLNFLLEIAGNTNTSSGRLLREFTLLLDPPVTTVPKKPETKSTGPINASTLIWHDPAMKKIISELNNIDKNEMSVADNSAL